MQPSLDFRVQPSLFYFVPCPTTKMALARFYGEMGLYGLIGTQPAFQDSLPLDFHDGQLTLL